MSHWIKKLCEPPDDSIRSRVLDYARQVRVLDFSQGVEMKEASLWIVLAECMGQTESLLPNLHELTVPEMEEAYFNYLARFIAPTLRRVTTLPCRNTATV